MNAVVVNDVVERANRKPFTYNDLTHVYMFDSQRCRSITALAKAVSDSFKLNEWQKRMVLIGLMMRRDLLEQAAAFIDDISRLNDIVQQAIDHAGATLKANRGTQAHAAIERDLTGLELHTEQQMLDAVIARRTFEAYGFVPNPQFIERAVLYPDDLVAGRTDMFGSWRWSSDWMINVDTKTGYNAVKYPWATAAQLALQVGAPLIQGLTHFEGSIEHTDRWDPMPENLRRDVSYVYLAPTIPDAEIGRFYEFTLTGRYAGEVAARAAIFLRHFQINNDMVRAVEPPLSLPSNVVSLHDDLVVAQATLRARIDGLNESLTEQLRVAWRNHVPPLGNVRATMNTEQVIYANALIDQFDSWAQVSELPPRPEPPDAVLSGPVPRWKPIEGDLMPVDVVGALRTAYEGLDDPIRDKVNTLCGQSLQHNCTFHVAADFVQYGTTSERRYWLILAAMELAANDACDAESIAYLAATVLDAEWPFDPRLRPGAVIGLLGVEHAEGFLDLSLRLINGELVVSENRLVPNDALEFSEPERTDDADPTRT